MKSKFEVGDLVQLNPMYYGDTGVNLLHQYGTGIIVELKTVKAKSIVIHTREALLYDEPLMTSEEPQRSLKIYGRE
tara:strand:- start:12640 stop:12867 length:228 start_codon:yes stop_codon:yes gene_type:complete